MRDRKERQINVTEKERKNVYDNERIISKSVR